MQLQLIELTGGDYGSYDSCGRFQFHFRNHLSELDVLHHAFDFVFTVNTR